MDQLLQVLRIKGRATPEALEAVVEADATAAIEQLRARGLVESTSSATGSPSSAAPGRELYAHEREQAGPVIDEVYESFVPINDEVKQIVTDWQMRPVGGELVLNDHRTAATTRA